MEGDKFGVRKSLLLSAFVINPIGPDYMGKNIPGVHDVGRIRRDETRFATTVALKDD